MTQRESKFQRERKKSNSVAMSVGVGVLDWAESLQSLLLHGLDHSLESLTTTQQTSSSSRCIIAILQSCSKDSPHLNHAIQLIQYTLSHHSQPFIDTLTELAKSPSKSDRKLLLHAVRAISLSRQRIDLDSQATLSLGELLVNSIMDHSHQQPTLLDIAAFDAFLALLSSNCQVLIHRPVTQSAFWVVESWFGTSKPLFGCALRSIAHCVQFCSADGFLVGLLEMLYQQEQWTFGRKEAEIVKLASSSSDEFLKLISIALLLSKKYYRISAEVLEVLFFNEWIDGRRLATDLQGLLWKTIFRQCLWQKLFPNNAQLLPRLNQLSDQIKHEILEGYPSRGMKALLFEPQTVAKSSTSSITTPKELLLSRSKLQ
jgi:hypothetical protein